MVYRQEQRLEKREVNNAELPVKKLKERENDFIIEDVLSNGGETIPA